MERSNFTPSSLPGWERVKLFQSPYLVFHLKPQNCKRFAIFIVSAKSIKIMLHYFINIQYVSKKVAENILTFSTPVYCWHMNHQSIFVTQRFNASELAFLWFKIRLLIMGKRGTLTFKWSYIIWPYLMNKETYLVIRFRLKFVKMRKEGHGLVDNVSGSTTCGSEDF